MPIRTEKENSETTGTNSADDLDGVDNAASATSHQASIWHSDWILHTLSPQLSAADCIKRSSHSCGIHKTCSSISPLNFQIVSHSTIIFVILTFFDSNGFSPRPPSLHSNTLLNRTPPRPHRGSSNFNAIASKLSPPVPRQTPRLKCSPLRLLLLLHLPSPPLLSRASSKIPASNNRSTSSHSRGQT